jgi:hypothetical protein
MIKINITSFMICGLLLSACNTSQASVNNSQASISSTELTGAYDCFAIHGTNTSDIGVLTLNADQTGTFGSNPIHWEYEADVNRISFEGDPTLRDGTYFSDGPSLSVNENSEDHFTCVKSE